MRPVLFYLPSKPPSGYPCPSRHGEERKLPAGRNLLIMRTPCGGEEQKCSLSFSYQRWLAPSAAPCKGGLDDDIRRYFLLSTRLTLVFFFLVQYPMTVGAKNLTLSNFLKYSFIAPSFIPDIC